MLGYDKAGVDKILLQLEAGGYLHPQYKLYKENGEPRLLGSGGFSSVYELYDVKNTEMHYAAKVVGLSEKTVKMEVMERTTQLQYALSQQSEHILRVIELWEMKLKLDEGDHLTDVRYPNSPQWEEDGIPIAIVVMEKLEPILERDRYGNATIFRDELKSEEGVLSFAKQIGEAIFTVHSNNVLHRDIKLENIFWNSHAERYELGDFGIARYVEGGSAETVVFTEGYGAPEIEKRLADSYNASADIYSFGVTLYLLLNELCFPASDGYYVNTIQYSKDFVFPAPAHATERMAGIIRRMCSYRAEERYQSVEEVLMEMGRLDGTFAEDGFVDEEELPTETYREETIQSGNDPSEAAGEDSETKPASEEEASIWSKPYRELTRHERKVRKEVEEVLYREDSLWRMLFFAVLFVLLFESFSPGADYVSSWQFLLLPVMVLTNVVAIRLREARRGIAWLTTGFCVYSMIVSGADVPQVTMILVLWMGEPTTLAGCAIGTILWIGKILTGKLAWLSFLNRWDLGWIVIILLIMVIENQAFLALEYNKWTLTDLKEELTGQIYIAKIGILAGIVLLALHYFEILMVPQIWSHIHLIRTGIALYVIVRCCLWMCNEKEKETNEHMDE